ncbi:phospholipase A1-Igamma3, chloroplastic-like protein [Cinnamomum micranthum f. kanehirae]|uniref:Phospholipase A1-Igamma3, chloroplastic-like protein n=1 Tax=Cinnamomum micranthum f. kanehirae TaxID=337451 RepID=A0A443PSK2_9MAGN|nr:phospholipase A1-Igamma3, chloroplastic-like protein [Cinnamomum micranthum f. kanehirae]
MASSLAFFHVLSLRTIPSPTCKPSSTNSLFIRTKPMFQSKKRVSFLPRCASITSFRPTIADDQTEEKFLSEFWKEIQGCNNWEGLLDPLNPVLRNEIIRYGELAQACYDAFDFDPFSKYCGTCKYLGSHFFEKLDMEERGYQISRYLYATSNINLPNFFQKSKMSNVWSQHANWMGYVAVATDPDEIDRLGRRDIVVAWRGTVTYLEWIHDLKDILRPASFGEDPNIKIESGFFDLYTEKEHKCNYCAFSAREQILAEIKRLVERYKGEDLSITITGHSLGAALALISAYDLAEMKLNVLDGEDGERKIPITVYSFSGPRVGNLKFKERCEELDVKVLRVINVHDKVPMVPGIITNEKFQYQKYVEELIKFPWSYAHVGVELALDHTNSPFLKGVNDLGALHNLEVHLHLLDGYHGKGRRFCLVNKRDIALVNKSCDILKDDFGVPPNWRQDHNKGMVRTVDGRWVVPERPRMEAHPPDTGHHLEQVWQRVKSRLNAI